MSKDKNQPDKTPEEASTPEKEVRIYSLATTQNECIIFLEEVGGNRLLPIWIGLAEGQAIAIRFSGIVLPRPLTHDLLLATVTAVGFAVQKVVVHDIRENTFYAKVHIKKGNQSLAIDARPSDAIAVAVRAGCTIFVEEKVFDRCQTLTKPITEDEVKKFKSELKNLKPEDIFGDLKKKKPEEGPQSRKEPEKKPDEGDEEADD
ncbi:MAG: bifunctional nuclease family protein [Elusimicrobia bacterium]|nr:bifunctional nuclease family protein [Elusimicrobiota bacterium]